MKIPRDTTFDNKDPYKILGVAAGAAPAAIRKAYLELAKRNHPNLFATDPEKYRATTVLMQDINAAYELLSDPARREFWDRQRPGAPSRPRRQATARSAYYDSEHVHLVIKTYNEFVDSLQTPQERRSAARRIRAFQASPGGSAFIRNLVASHYKKVIDLLNQGRRISLYDDGLVEFMFLYAGALEVAPSEVFITYAYVLYRQTRGKTPAGPQAPEPQQGGPGPGDTQPPLLRLRYDRGPDGPAKAKTVGSRVWRWLMSKPGQQPEPGRRPRA